jgi:hypothetical protein
VLQFGHSATGALPEPLYWGSPERSNSMPATYETLTGTCSKCDGTGSLPHYGHISNGVCFQCQGSGKLSFRVRTDGTAKTSLEVFKRGGAFSYASLRSTLLAADGTWGKCLIAREINDAAEARVLWRDLIGQDHTHLAVTDGEHTQTFQTW